MSREYRQLCLRINRADASVGGTPRETSWKWFLENFSDDVNDIMAMPVRRAGIPHYHQLAFVHGLFEFSVLRHRDGEENVQNISDIVGDSKALPYDDWKAILARNTRFAVAPCHGRHLQLQP